MGSESETGTGTLAAQVKGAVLWRSGSQIVGQLVTWASTFLVIRALNPADYGLLAMTQVVMLFLGLLEGWGFASGLVRDKDYTRERGAQVFGLLIILNTALAAAQFALAPLAAAYFRQPMVEDLLRVQALFYLVTPFISLPQALLSREMDFKRQALVNLTGAVVSAATAISCAYSGLGVWTLVAAPGAYWVTKAIGMSLAARLDIWPSFRFAGIGGVARYGGAMLLVQVFWFVQIQSDVFIAGRLLTAHDLGVYTTALFLTQILAAKFVPPLNDVAFAAYSRIQDRHDVVQTAYLKSVRLITLVALPFYFGLAVTADPLVRVFLGEKWVETIPLIPVLAMAMPLMTLQILFAPATNAMGHARIAVRTSMAGALIMPAAFALGVCWEAAGLVWAWLIAMAVLLVVTATLSFPVLALRRRDYGRAIAPALFASLAMAGAVMLIDRTLGTTDAAVRLLILVGAGAAVYGAWLILFSRRAVEDAWALIRKAAPEPAARAA